MYFVQSDNIFESNICSKEVGQKRRAQKFTHLGRCYTYLTNNKALNIEHETSIQKNKQLLSCFIV